MFSLKASPSVGITAHSNSFRAYELVSVTPILLPAIPPEAIYPAQPELGDLLSVLSKGRLTQKKSPSEAQSQLGLGRLYTPKTYLIKIAPRTSKVKLFQKAQSCQPLLLQVSGINDNGRLFNPTVGTTDTSLSIVQQ